MLVVRMMGSSLRVEYVVDGGGAVLLSLGGAAADGKGVDLGLAGEVVRVERLR